MKKVKVFLFGCLVLISSLVLAVFYYRWAVERRHPGGAGVVNFVITPGEEVAAIAQRLERAGLINSASLFRIYARSGGFSSTIQAGRYKIPQNLSLRELVELLQHGTFDVKLTFIEGWRREEMAGYLKSKIPAAGRTSPGGKNRKSKIDEEFLQASQGLEGYLFPDTYLVPSDVRASDLVKVMKENFDQKVTAAMVEEAAKNGLTLRQVVVLASIVERESKFGQDRPLVAGILLKRYQNGWPLEADATVQYAKAKAAPSAGNFWPKQLTQEDLELDSPYNTRKNVGLPPSPICNPGLAAIRAVIYPQNSSYWYYLSDSLGVMHYAETLEQHNRNIAKYL